MSIDQNLYPDYFLNEAINVADFICLKPKDRSKIESCVELEQTHAEAENP